MNIKEKNSSQIRKKTAIANILAIIALLFFAYYLGYKNSNLLLEIVCLTAFPFAVFNAYKYFFKQNYRKHLNEYHDQQKSLPKEKRDGYRFGRFLEINIGLGLIGIGIIILLILTLNFL